MRCSRASRPRPLVRDERGAALLEFGIVAPVMCLFLMGGLDMGHTLYVQSVLQGVVQKTGRDSALETGADAAQQAIIDARVTAQVKAVASNATITFSRRFYRTFASAQAARPEDFTDNNGNGTCDGPAGTTPGEPYIDANNNGTWDRDGGDAGQGGAKDKTVYTVTVTYPRLFPIKGFIPALSADQTLKATTVLQNQPYSDQGSYTVTTTVRNCA